MASPAYPDAWLVMIAIGTAKGMIIIINDYCHHAMQKECSLNAHWRRQLVKWILKSGTSIINPLNPPPPLLPDLFFSSMCEGGLFESGADLIS